MKNRQSGFSLPEMLVVIAIIAVVSLVTVPNFMALRRQNMLKNSMRNFMSDVRTMRQRAVSKHEQTKLVWTAGSTTGRQYTLSEKPTSAAAWTQVGAPKEMDELCYVDSDENIPAGGGSTHELVFRSDGTAILSPSLPGKVVVKTDYPKEKLYTNAYTVSIQFSGAVKADSTPK